MTKRMLNVEDKKMCRSLFWRTMTLSATYNYETMQALGFTYSMIPVIRRYYSNKEDQIKALKRHNELFNTTPTMGGLITGLVASMEQEASKDPENFDFTTISSVKVALMGPFAGIGDSLFLGALKVITMGVGISIAMTGNILGAIIHVVLFNALAHIVRYYGTFASFSLGESFMSKASNSDLMGKLTKGASIVGLMTVGAMSVTMVSCNIQAVIDMQGNQVVVQDLLNSIFPSLVPLLLVFGCYKLIKKNINPAIIILGLLIIGVIGKYLGVF